MVIRKIPRRIYLLSVTALLMPVLVSLQLIVQAEWKWWRVTWLELRYPLLSLLFCAVTFIFLTFCYRFWATRWLKLVFSVWTALTLYQIYQRPYVGLIIFFVGLCVYAYFFVQRCEMTFQAPFLFSGMTWYQGLPQGIPHLHGEIVEQGETLPFFPKIVDQQGVFGVVTLQDQQPIPTTVTVKLKYRELEIALPAEIIAAKPLEFGSFNHGIGLKFNRIVPDEWKDWMDFIEVLRGEGYAI